MLPPVLSLSISLCFNDSAETSSSALTSCVVSTSVMTVSPSRGLPAVLVVSMLVSFSLPPAFEGRRNCLFEFASLEDRVSLVMDASR